MLQGHIDGVKGGFNPNQANPMAAWMSYAYIYFGGEAAVNMVLSTFNFDTLISKTKQYGWNSDHQYVQPIGNQEANDPGR